ncbi:MAG: DUF460 domain-containing protein [Candidatus Bilamarchaeaceae archaeon]
MYIIVGVDAGIKTGYAILNLKGGIVAVGVERGASHERIVKIISGFGTPSVIATDVNPAPSFVDKIAARFSVPLFLPGRVISLEEKKRIGKGIVDPHIRDAYAAAVKAYRHYANRLRQIEKLALGQNERERRKHLLIRGMAVGKLSEER